MTHVLTDDELAQVLRNREPVKECTVRAIERAVVAKVNIHVIDTSSERVEETAKRVRDDVELPKPFGYVSDYKPAGYMTFRHEPWGEGHLIFHSTTPVFSGSQLRAAVLADREKRGGNAIRDLIAKHAELLGESDYTYFELARTRQTDWMAWICSHPSETHPDRKILARGQGETPDAACRDAMADLSYRAALSAQEGTADCWCETCRPNTFGNMRMILCQTCGNKRCPHATDHRNACTVSNEPGQPGSSYENVRRWNPSDAQGTKQ